MRSVRPVVIVLGLSLVFLVALKIGLNSYNLKSATPGCAPLTSSGLVDPTNTVAFWQNQALAAPLALDDTLTASQKRVLGATTENKWIEVDLGKQLLIAHQGDAIFVQSPISSGLWDSTPPGQYHIWYKITSTLMEGGSKLNNTYYYLPNVPYDMFFYNDYAIHGTYWHHNFGHPMSHGCVNTPTPVAEQLFYWTDPQLPPGATWVKAGPDNPGTLIVIHP